MPDETMTVTRRQSIARIEMMVDASRPREDWLFTLFFEEAFYDGNDNVVPGTQRFPSRIVARRWSQIKDEAQISALHSMLRRKAYEWLAEDASRPSPDDLVRAQAESMVVPLPVPSAK